MIMIMSMEDDIRSVGFAFLAWLALCILLFSLWKYCIHHHHRHQEDHQEDQERNEVSEPLILEDYSKQQIDLEGSFEAGLSSSEHNLEENLSQRLPATESNGKEHKTDLTVKAHCLILEVISGPSAGVRLSQEPSPLSLTIGRVPQNTLVLNDPEVSGKHAFIRWNSGKSMWELVDMGSLNGTLVNKQPIRDSHHRNGNPRHHGDPVELADGDILTLGSTSQVLVQILGGGGRSPPMPFGVGIAMDPMTTWRSHKKNAMEDVCLCEWPLQGFQQQFGVFCLFDGHAGVTAAEAACKIMPEKLADILKSDTRRISVLDNCDATDVLRDAFRETEEALQFEFEGCTATVLLLWRDMSETFYAQCANVGDSHCIFSVGGKFTQLTEDHRLTSATEKSRFIEMGYELKEGQVRICGMNIARVLGDKFLKEQDERFSANPFVSEVLRLTTESESLAVIASDGLWDVLSPKRAMQIALQVRQSYCTNEGRSDLRASKRIADMLVKEARTLRTKDNTSVLVLDFMLGLKSSLNAI